MTELAMMHFEILSVRDPVWSDAENTRIDCKVWVSAYSEELPFTASPNDTVDHGREIFRRCLSGEFGKVRPFESLPGEVSSLTEDPLIETRPNWISAWPEVHEFIQEANLENARSSPRGSALVWGCMLERMLESLIHFKLELQGRGKNSLQCADGRKCKDDFRSRIDGAVHESMIDPKLGPHLHAIRHIRNVCAHEWELNYDNPKVKKLEADLIFLRSVYFPTFRLNDWESMIKMVFSSACCQIIIYLAEHAIAE